MKNYIGNYKFLLAVCSLLAMVVACEEDFEPDYEIAVTSRAVSLSSSAGTTPVMVYSDGDWTVHFDESIDWGSLDRTKGHGINQFKFSYAANYGVARSVSVVLTKGSATDTVVFTQSGTISDVSLSFDKSALTLLKSPEQVVSDISTNLRYCLSAIEGSVAYYNIDGTLEGTVDMAIGSETPQVDSLDTWLYDFSLAETGLTFYVTENDSGSIRLAVLTLSIESADGTITQTQQTITQSLSSPDLSFMSSNVTVDGVAQECEVLSLNNNISAYSDRVDYSVEYSGSDSDWVYDMSLSSEGLTFNVSQNDSEDERSATITVAFTDGLGNSVSAEVGVTQAVYPALMEFTELRALSAGTITESRYIEGFVVSDPDSENICSAPQTAQFYFDRSEIYKTVYLESTDGTYGVCLKFDSSSENTLEQFARVKINLSGLTLEINDDPLYYTLTGLSSSSILETKSANELNVPVKYKTIAELTDDDIFTLTSVTGLEILQKDGCYTNCSDGYSYKDSHNASGSSSSMRWDVAPLLCYDAEGESIFMLTNAGVSWRRDGEDLGFYGVLPQGSGTFRGIVVSDDVVTTRFGDCGTYQLRAMVEDDIDLNEDCFSTTLVEWTWDDVTTDLEPETGSGSISLYGSAYSGTASDYNNTTSYGNGGSTSNLKGLVRNAAICFYNTWWDFDNDIGNYFDISFSTSGISGSSMIFGLVWGHGKLSATSQDNPDHWKLLYSVDGGDSFSEVPDAGTIKARGIVWWTTTTNDSCPGFTEHIVKLPSECFDKESVVLRLQVEDTVCDAVPSSYSTEEYWTNLSVEQGTLTSSITAANCHICIGTISIRYN